MEKTELIRKWLDNELTDKELKAFQSLEDHEDLIKISKATKRFETSDYDVKAELGRLNNRISTKTSKVIFLKPFLRVAAILVLFVGIYFSTSLFSKNTEIHTLIAQKETITLPDNSTVVLNAVSNLAYDKNSWQDKRSVTLSGEAYFKVAKGSTFSVQTSNGVISVLGTEFNIQNRDNHFEVVCYEGSVKVQTADKEVILKSGDRFRESKLVKASSNSLLTKEPSWTRNESSFEKTPFKEVISEFERQYSVKITTDTNLANKLFTGSFTHEDLNIAIMSISLPFNLSYTREGNEVTLSRD